jgi:hypothetical protein
MAVRTRRNFRSWRTFRFVLSFWKKKLMTAGLYFMACLSS